MTLYGRRKLRDTVARALAIGAALFGLAWLFAILVSLLWEGIASLSLQVFTETTPPPGSSGGLLNAIAGSLVMTALATALGTPVGILAGTYMAEYGRHAKLTTVVRFVNDVLLSAPSIIVGLFVYEVLVVPMGHFSAWAGVAALAILVLPIVVRTTEDMLNLVPSTLREAAAALGAPRWRVIMQVAYRAALNGIVTGALLAVRRAS